MKERPTLETTRLTLRPFTVADASDVQRLAGEREIASNMLNIPHPYEEGMAEQWIATHQERYEKGELVNFAITLRVDQALIGAIGLQLTQRHASAELGYWIGKPFWNRGYCTEAAQAVVRYGFDVIGLNRLYAAYFKCNPASGRVMQKLGMRYEGCMREHVKKWGVFEDRELYGLLSRDYLSQKENASSIPIPSLRE